MTNMVFGGGGGAGSSYAEQAGQAGQNGSGIVILLAKTISVSGGINDDGVNGLTYPNGYGGNGGSGAGGSVLFVCKDATIGSSLVHAVGGTAGTATGAAGGIGRIALHYSGSYSGSTNPTLYANLDPSLVEVMGGGAFLFNMI